jgi:hypothetical protein
MVGVQPFPIIIGFGMERPSDTFHCQPIKLQCVSHKGNRAMKLFLPFLISSVVSVSSAFAASCTAPNSIIKVSNSRIGVREMVTFRIKAPLSGTYSITAGHGPTFIEDGSGNPIHVGGNRWTDVTFRQMNWLCSTPTHFVLPKHVIKDIKLIGQFEGQIEYVVGRRNGHYLGHTVSTSGGITRIKLKYGP